MLELKPNCECCDRELPPDSPLAMICTFECTFCTECATERFAGHCPTCTGELLRRPTRAPAWLARFPAATRRTTKPHPECASI